MERTPSRSGAIPRMMRDCSATSCVGGAAARFNKCCHVSVTMICNPSPLEAYLYGRQVGLLQNGSRSRYTRTSTSRRFDSSEDKVRLLVSLLLPPSALLPVARLMMLLTGRAGTTAPPNQGMPPGHAWL
eukprot:scaffold60178_cov32-Prasinocladus_malaysianus.AAC.1